MYSTLQNPVQFSGNLSESELLRQSIDSSCHGSLGVSPVTCGCAPVLFTSRNYLTNSIFFAKSLFLATISGRIGGRIATRA
jgi:hypothetical protein